MAAFSRTYAGRSRRAVCSGMLQVFSLALIAYCLSQVRTVEHPRLAELGTLLGVLGFALGIPLHPTGYGAKWCKGVSHSFYVVAVLALFVVPMVWPWVLVPIGLATLGLGLHHRARVVRRRVRRTLRSPSF